MSYIWNEPARTKQVVFSRHYLKKSQAREGEKSKTRLTFAFFVNSAGEKVIETRESD